MMTDIIVLQYEGSIIQNMNTRNRYCIIFSSDDPIPYEHRCHLAPGVGCPTCPRPSVPTSSLLVRRLGHVEIYFGVRAALHLAVKVVENDRSIQAYERPITRGVGFHPRTNVNKPDERACRCKRHADLRDCLPPRQKTKFPAEEEHDDMGDILNWIIAEISRKYEQDPFPFGMGWRRFTALIIALLMILASMLLRRKQFNEVRT